VAVNTLGAFLLCALLPRLGPAVRLPLATGLLASFTTFSGFAVDAVLLADAGRLGAAAGYVGLSLVLLLAAGAAGLRLSTWRGARR
jgi:CrcB protein